MSERCFGPSKSGEKGLALVLAIAAFAILYFFWVTNPDFPDVRRSSYQVFLVTTVLFVAAISAWNWKRFAAEIVVSEKGIMLHATGGVPVPRAVLPWRDISKLELDVETRPRGGHLRFLVFVSAPDAEKPGRRYSIILEGLEDDIATILEGIALAATDQGYALVGPRPGHVGQWFNGMNWHLEPLDDAVRGSGSSSCT